MGLLTKDILVVCAECNGLTFEKSHGNEGWTVCQDCGQIEGSTKEMTIEEYEGLQSE